VWLVAQVKMKWELEMSLGIMWKDGGCLMLEEAFLYLGENNGYFNSTLISLSQRNDIFPFHMYFPHKETSFHFSHLLLLGRFFFSCVQCTIM